jgi:guanylate kinase
VSRGRLIIVSSPSGAGKTTLCKRLIGEFAPKLRFSVSFTTRPPRPAEQDGVDYRFVDNPSFDKMIANDEFAEWAPVHGNRYGTSRAWVAEALSGGSDVLFDIDYQGGRQLKAQFANDAVMIFILPPSLAVLEQRLRQRATDSEASIELRLRNSLGELDHYLFYDYLVINDELERAYGDVRAIYLSTRCDVHRQALWAERLIREARTRGK